MAEGKAGPAGPAALPLGSWAWLTWPHPGVYELVAVDDDGMVTWRRVEGWPR